MFIRPRMLIAASLAAIMAFGISCTSDGRAPTGLSSAPVTPAVSPSLIGNLLNNVTQNVVSPLLTCAPQPYAADTLTVGPSGGTLVIGPHRFVVPAGALDSSVTIIADAPVGTVVQVRFQPEGLHFKKSATLTLDYSACGLVQNLLPKRVAYTNDSLNILSYLLSVDDLLNRRVSGKVDHFSRYAIAW